MFNIVANGLVANRITNIELYFLLFDALYLSSIPFNMLVEHKEQNG